MKNILIIAKHYYQFLNMILFTFLPLLKKTVVFEGFNRTYIDSPKYVSEMIHMMDSTITIVWALNDIHEKDIPEYVKKVRYRSLKHLRLMSSCQVYVDNYVGKITLSGIRMSKILKRLDRDDQLNVSIWHGTPCKVINKQNIDGVFCTSDLFVSGSEYNTHAVLDSFGLRTATLEVGLPRNDKLLSVSRSEQENIKMKMHIPNDKRIALYAPTFREYQKSKSSKLELFLEPNTLIQTLKESFGGEWILVIRIHPSVVKNVDEESMKVFNNETVYYGNVCNDMTDYLITCDVLISDYSGSLFDIALTDKPSFIFAPDYAEYKNVERGLLFDLRQFPQSTALNEHDLIQNIRNYRQTEYNEKRLAFLDRIKNKETGRASKLVAQRIIDYINNCI